MGGGAPRLSRWNARIFAARSALSPPPVLLMVLCGGLRAALMLPSGVDEAVILAVVAREGDFGSP